MEHPAVTFKFEHAQNKKALMYQWFRENAGGVAFEHRNSSVSIAKALMGILGQDMSKKYWCIPRVE